jgi:hypothetical protein
MGYTHYWERPAELDPQLFGSWSDDVRKLIAAARREGVLIVDGLAETDEPTHTPDEVSFNGKPDHETFRIPRIYDGHTRDEKLKFEFCKTARKPYDIVAAASLIALKFRFGDAVEVSSDGDMEDWKDAVELADSVLGTAENWAFVNDGTKKGLQQIPD